MSYWISPCGKCVLSGRKQWKLIEVSYKKWCFTSCAGIVFVFSKLVLLQVRVNYLRSKKFTKKQIVKIITEFRYVTSFYFLFLLISSALT